MKLGAQNKTCQNCWSKLRSFRLVFAILFSVALIVGQASPMQARHLAAGDSEWIEICGGDDGSYFVQIDQDGESQDQHHDCKNCSLCAVAGSGANAVLAANGGIVYLSVVMNVGFPLHFSVVTDRPEQLWSSSRAPPTKRTKQNSLFCSSFFQKILHRDFYVSARINRVRTS